MQSLKSWLEADPTRTQVALARVVGVKAPSLNEWVHGDSSPSSQRLQALHEATGIPLADLIADCANDAAERKRTNAA